MSRFKKFSIQGFRKLRNVEQELRPLNVIIGANGVGKSSFLDAFHLLARSAEGHLNQALSSLSGLSSILTIDHAQELGLGIDTEVGGAAHLDYRLVLEPRGSAYGIQEESLRQRSANLSEPVAHINSKHSDIHYYEVTERKLVRPNWEHSPYESSLAQVPKQFQEPESFRLRLASCTYYHALDIGSRAPVRLPQAMRPAELPGSNGEDLISCLYSLREGDRNRFDAISDALMAAFPGFERLDFPPVAAGMLAMTWRDRRFTRPLYMNELSEGTLRFLWLVTLLQSPGLSAVTMIDEPEVSLHPELLNLLATLMREAAQRTQLVIATHSDRLVRFLEPNEVLVADADEEGLTTLTWADSMELEEWLAEYSLDELWQKGRLGGRA